MKRPNFPDSKAYLISYPVESFCKPILIGPQKTYVGRDLTESLNNANAKDVPEQALITSENGCFYLEDLESCGGTYLNGRRIKKVVLNSHDKIKVGDRTFLFLSQTGPIDLSEMGRTVADRNLVSLSDDETDLAQMWAQNAENAARGFIQRALNDPAETSHPDQLAHARLSMLYQLSESLRTTKFVGQIYDQGLDLILEAIPGADRAFAVIKTASEETYQAVAVKLRRSKEIDGNDLPISRTLFDWVLRERVTLVSQNICDDHRFQDSDSIRIHDLRSIICAPMISKKNVIGLLYAETHSHLYGLSQEDAAFVSAVANEVALNIDHIRLQKSVLRNEQMAAVGLTVSNLAHNVKNMIALNQGAAQLMDKHVEEIGSPQIEKNWEWLRESLAGINRLTMGMLDYVKEDDLNLRSIDINQTISDCRSAFESSLSGDALKIEYSLDSSNPKWMMDEVQFKRAIVNLVLNAAHAVKEKGVGRIRISTSISELGHLVVSVVDNGCGIKLDQRSKLFELFFTTKGTEGTGLGLPMVRKFTEKMGGKLTFNSKEGTGSIFKMVFPEP